MNRSLRFDPEPFEFFAEFEGELPGYDTEFAYEEEVEIPVSVTVRLSWSKTDLNGYSRIPTTAGFYTIVHGESAYVGRELNVYSRFYQRHRVITTELNINPDCFRNVQVYFANHPVSRPRTELENNYFHAVEVALIQNWQGTLRNKDRPTAWLARNAEFEVINYNSLAQGMPNTARLKHTSRRPRT